MAEDVLKVQGVRQLGFGIIPKLVMQDPTLSLSAKAVYAYFCSFAGSGTTCFPSRKKMCFDLGISNDTLGKYIRELTGRGLISVAQAKENGRFSHNIYMLLDTILPCPKNSDTESPEYEIMDTNNNSSNNNSYSNNNNDNKKERKKPDGSFDKIIEDYSSDEEVRSLLREWLKIRKLKRAPLTDRALSMNLNKLDAMAKESEMSVVAYLQEVVERGWAAFYAIKRNGNNQSFNKQPERRKQAYEYYSTGDNPDAF